MRQRNSAPIPPRRSSAAGRCGVSEATALRPIVAAGHAFVKNLRRGPPPPRSSLRSVAPATATKPWWFRRFGAAWGRGDRESRPRPIRSARFEDVRAFISCAQGGHSGARGGGLSAWSMRHPQSAAAVHSMPGFGGRDVRVRRISRSAAKISSVATGPAARRSPIRGRTGSRIRPTREPWSHERRSCLSVTVATGQMVPAARRGRDPR